MAGALERPATRAGVTFELERSVVEDGEIVITGRWYGVRGMRFVRPTLVVDDRQALATLEHKPWAPHEDELWTAAFPWSDELLELDAAALSVAPSVTVPLGGDTPEPPHPKPRRRKPAKRPDAPRAGASLARTPLPTPPDAGADARAALRAELAEVRQVARDREARCRDLEEMLSRERAAVAAAMATRAELEPARAAAERHAELATAQRDEAVKDREAAVRTRGRMEVQLEEAVRDRHAATEARDEALAQRDEARAQRDEARAQRDEVLLAHRALERELRALHAGRDGEGPEPVGGERAESRGGGRAQASAAGDSLSDDADVPIGVRSVPAARMVAAQLHRAESEGHQDLSRYDLWAIRFFGTVAAACFILLLALLLRLFL